MMHLSPQGSSGLLQRMSYLASSNEASQHAYLTERLVKPNWHTSTYVVGDSKA